MKTNLTIEDINSFIEGQLRLWNTAAINFRFLRKACRMNLELKDLRGAKQHNPARITSTNAKVDEASLRKRACFLCEKNRPPEQITVPWVAGWHLLMNPYPILPVHFTIVNPEHTPQAEIPLVLASMAEAAPDLVFFYNGARAGASAPDHQHAQAVLKSELPLMRIVERYHPSSRGGWMSSEEYGLDLPFQFVSAVVTPDSEGMVTLARCVKAFGIDAETGKQDTGLLNAFFWIGEGGLLRIAIVPRRRHRPACFFKEDPARMIISPGAIDMAGLMIIPRECDFDRANAEDICQIYGEVAFADSLPDEIREHFGLSLSPDEFIRVGIITKGMPEFTPAVRFGTEGICLDNLLIGEGFHWEKAIRTFLPGKIERLKEPQGNIRLVNILPLELYLMVVISSEMNPEAPIEFLKAHAVISRSWAMRKIREVGESSGLNNPAVSRNTEASAYMSDESGQPVEEISWEESDLHWGFDVCSDDHCQRYQGYNEKLHPNARKAVEETRGLVLLDSDGAVADARFSKCCGGRTEIFSSCWADQDFNYLNSFEDTWCDLSGMSISQRTEFLSAVLKDYDAPTADFREWKVKVQKDALRKAVKSRYGIDLGVVLDMRPEKRGPSGRIISLRIIGERNEIVIGKELAIRRLLSENCLYSSKFDIEPHHGYFLLKGSGWGHGVGLCQIGAARMASEGYDFKAILSFYYPNTYLGTL